MAYISKLEASGFKSLGSLDVRFPRGMCCLAGPNGAGKSCIMEAVAFVAGCSAPTLRVDRLAQLQCTDMSKVPPNSRHLESICLSVLCAVFPWL